MRRRDSGSVLVCCKRKASKRKASQAKFLSDPRKLITHTLFTWIVSCCCRDSVKFIDRHRFLSSHFEILILILFGEWKFWDSLFSQRFCCFFVPHNWAWRFVARRRRKKKKKKKKCQPVKSIDRHRFISFIFHIWSFVECREPFFPQIFELFLLHTILFLEICY